MWAAKRPVKLAGKLGSCGPEAHISSSYPLDNQVQLVPVGLTEVVMLKNMGNEENRTFIPICYIRYWYITYWCVSSTTPAFSD